MNITILATLFATIFGRLLGRWCGALAALVAIADYTLLVVADAAVVRAAIMGEVALLQLVTKPKAPYSAEIVPMAKYDIIKQPNQWHSVASASTNRIQGETHE